MKQENFWKYSTTALVRWVIFLAIYLGFVICTVIHRLVDDGLVFNIWQLHVPVWSLLHLQYVRELLRLINAKHPTP